MAYSAAAVANWFIERARAEGKFLTQMQLHKLVYFSHALSLASIGKPLVDEAPAAVEFGPVFPELYEFTKEYGGSPITMAIHIAKGLGDLRIPVLPGADKHARHCVESTWKTFGSMSATRLSRLSHEDNGPWHRIYNAGKGVWKRIPNEWIGEFYQTKLAERHA